MAAPKTSTVRALCRVSIPDVDGVGFRIVDAGDDVELPAEQAAGIIAHGWAVGHDEPTPAA